MKTSATHLVVPFLLAAGLGIGVQPPVASAAPVSAPSAPTIVLPAAPAAPGDDRTPRPTPADRKSVPGAAATFQGGVLYLDKGETRLVKDYGGFASALVGVFAPGPFKVLAIGPAALQAAAQYAHDRKVCLKIGLGAGPQAAKNTGWYRDSKCR